MSHIIDLHLLDIITKRCSTMTAIHLNTINADGINIFYREAGPPEAPTLLLLHGFPSSSHQYRNLIPLPSRKYHLLAQDLPGFGFTEIPESRNYKYTFDSLTTSIESFLKELNIEKFSIYIFDYGAPIGLRLALRQPQAIQSIISQNGNAYTEGLGEFWTPFQKLWKSQTPEELTAANEPIKSIISLDSTKWQYITGTLPPISIESHQNPIPSIMPYYRVLELQISNSIFSMIIVRIWIYIRSFNGFLGNRRFLFWRFGVGMMRFF